jgi:hypothetical protein
LKIIFQKNLQKLDPLGDAMAQNKLPKITRPPAINETVM